MVGRDTFLPLAPVLGPKQKKLAMSRSSTVHGGQYDNKYVPFEYLLHAEFVADTIWVFFSLNQLVRTYVLPTAYQLPV